MESILFKFEDKKHSTNLRISVSRELNILIKMLYAPYNYLYPFCSIHINCFLWKHILIFIFF